MNIYILSLGIRGTHENYGALLQIWAFKEYLQYEFNANVKVIDYSGLSNGKIQTENNNVKRKITEYPHLLYNKIRMDLIGRRKYINRFKKNNQFIRENFDLTIGYNYLTLPNAKFDSDIFIAESDVIWDPSFRNTGFDDAYFLNMKCFDKAIKKIVYAASLGDLKFSAQEKKDFAKKLNNLNYWSIREEYSKKFIYENYKLKCDVLIDPTLLLDSKYYEKFIQKKTKKNNYVLVYFPAEKNDFLVAEVEKYAAKYNLTIKYVMRTSKDFWKSNVYIDLGIDEFLTLLYNSSVVFCDSFHGICLSILFKKQFFAFLRDDGEKVLDICQKFNLEHRFITKEISNSVDINYDEVYKILNQERQKAKEWLKNAINC